MNAAIYRFAPYTGSLKIEQQTFCLVHSLFQFVWLSEDVYIIPPAFHSVKYFFEKILTLLMAKARSKAAFSFAQSRSLCLTGLSV